jgi:hypothetical protein
MSAKKNAARAKSLTYVALFEGTPEAPEYRMLSASPLVVGAVADVLLGFQRDRLAHERHAERKLVRLIRAGSRKRAK